MHEQEEEENEMGRRGRQPGMHYGARCLVCKLELGTTRECWAYLRVSHLKGEQSGGIFPPNPGPCWPRAASRTINSLTLPASPMHRQIILSAPRALEIEAREGGGTWR